MAESMRLYLPNTEFAKTDTDVSYFADKARLCLNFDPLNWETGIIDGANKVILKIDADNRSTTGAVTESDIDWACVYVRNWQDFGSGKQVEFKSTTSSGYTGLVSRGVRTFLTANGPLVHLNFNSTQDRYWQIEFQGLTGIAPQVELVMMGWTADIQARWNHGTPEVLFDRTVCELTPGGGFMGRKMRGAKSSHRVLTVETRAWEYASDADIATMQSVFYALSGPLLPFILKDYNATFMNQWRLVRFDPEVHGNGRGFTRVRTQSDYNDMQITIRDLPRIHFGNVI